MELEENTERTILPFAFKGLQKISRRELEIERGLFNYLPFATKDYVIQSALEGFLSKQFNLEAKIRLERIEEMRNADFIRLLPEHCLVGVLGIQPVTSKAMMWIDSVLAANLIDRVLGGKGDLLSELRSFSPIEEGVFQYLILKTLSHVYEATQDSTPVHFRLDRVAKSPKELTDLSSEDSSVLVHFRVQVGTCIGFVALCFPHPFIEGAFLQHEPLDHPGTQEYSLGLQRFDSVSFIKTQVWAEIGNVSLTISEKNQLEKGDVILFDQTQCQMSGPHLSGNVILRVGEGKGGGFLSQVVSADSPALIKVLDYYGGE
ncbi:MAG: hypothetical protein JNK65_06665 [Deltaproteobacteria bacterium]|nr:hypothetical protein [Deltaproteobacteria bacterium]